LEIVPVQLPPPPVYTAVLDLSISSSVFTEVALKYFVVVAILHPFPLLPPLPEPVVSPVKVIVFAEINPVALPFKVAVIVPALKLPLASLLTIVEAVLVFVALIQVGAADPFA